jgi:hypothetical protein
MLAERVADGELDPFSAADELIERFGAGGRS